MTTAYPTATDLPLFTEVKQQFDDMLAYLVADQAAVLEHGDLERYLEQQGNELLRRMLQAHFTHRAQQEQPLPKMPFSAHSRRQRHRARTQRTLQTIYGPVTVQRMGYSAEDEPSVFPLDAQLNLPGDRYSEGVRLRVVANAVHSAFDVSLKQLDLNTAAHVPKRQALALVQDIAQDFEAFYLQRQSAEPAVATNDLLVLTFDGKGIVMRPDSLREDTRKKAAQAQTKLQTRLSAGEKKGRKRMAQVAAVYDQPARKRFAEEIIRLPGEEELKPTAQPAIRHKRVWASVERDASAVIKEAFAEALKRDPNQKRHWVILIDGHKSQREQILRLLNRRQLKATIIMDFIHVLEYLWSAAWALYDKGDDAAETWVGERALKLLNGQLGQVLKGLQLQARPLSAKSREPLDACINYLRNNRNRLRYEQALAAGLPIATGVIEGACRHLINDRLDITGARWSLSGAEAILKLRSLFSSGDWEAYYCFHRQQAKHRLYGDYPPLSQAA